MDTDGTVEEALRLWRSVGRDNLMIKVPATAPGLNAIRRLIGDGINVNITLLFSQKVYEGVVEAYLGGLEDLAGRGGDPRGVASVASFFVSRIDTAIDKLIEARLGQATNAVQRLALTGIRGKVAIANAKLAYQRYNRLFAGSRWEALRAKGARTQRLLWASTGTKNPEYSDVLYVEELIGPDTINTMAAGHDGCLSGPWETARQPRGRSPRRAAGHGDARPCGHLDRPGDGQSPGRGYWSVHRRQEQGLGRDRRQARHGGRVRHCRGRALQARQRSTMKR